MAPQLPPLRVAELSLRLREGVQGQVAEWLARAPALRQLQWDCAPRGGAQLADTPLRDSTFTG